MRAQRAGAASGLLFCCVPSHLDRGPEAHCGAVAGRGHAETSVGQLLVLSPNRGNPSRCGMAAELTCCPGPGDQKEAQHRNLRKQRAAPAPCASTRRQLRFRCSSAPYCAGLLCAVWGYFTPSSCAAYTQHKSPALKCDTGIPCQ